MFSKALRLFFIPILTKHKKIFLFLLLDGAISGAFSVLIPILLKLETDQLMEQKPAMFLDREFSAFTLFVFILVCILLAEITHRLISKISTIYLDAEKGALQNRIQLELFRRMNDMEVGKTMNSRFRKLSRVLESEFGNLTNTILHFPRNFIEKGIQVFGMTAIFLYFDYRFLIIVVMSAVLTYYIDIYSDRVRQKYEIHWKFSLEQKTWHYSDLFFRFFSQLATNGAVNTTIHSYDQLLQEEVRRGVRKNWAELTWVISGLFTGSISQMFIKIMVGYSVFVGTQSIGMVALVVASMGTVEELIRSLLNLRKGYLRFRFEESSLFLFLDMCAPVGVPNPEHKLLHINEVDFTSVHFAYPNLSNYELEYLQLVKNFIKGGKTGVRWIDEGFEELIDSLEEDKKNVNPPILSGIHLSLRPGKIYGIVGKNGAGKTTLMQLLSGFYRNYEGDIRVSGVELRNLRPEILARNISFLTQDPFFMSYNVTVDENLFLGVEHKDESQAWKYLEQFGLAEKIKRSPKGLLSEVGDDIEFSGGEKQVLAFVRILLQDRPIIILDEGTNQLDAENEIMVMSELLKQKKDKIIIFITHRMSTISRADEIHCIEERVISHSGNHKSLLQDKKNPYARFYEAQILHENVLKQ